MYDNPNRIKYAFFYDAGNTANETWSFTGPKGKAGRLYDYGVEGITEVFTTGASLAIGTAADPDHFGEELSFAAAAVDTDVKLRDLDPIADKAAFDALLVIPEIPAGTLVQMTLVDDAATGIGVFFCVIDWDD
jgi:hypothetical protein